MEITGVDDFKARLNAAMSAGLTENQALVLLQMKQKERHHVAAMKKLDEIQTWIEAIRKGRGPFWS